MSQLALPLDWRQWNEPLSFIVGEANRLAVRYLDRPAIWPVRTALLVGPRKSGKSLLGREFAAGLFTEGDSSLFVNRGVGTSRIPVRFLSPPEAALLTLTRGDAP